MSQRVYLRIFYGHGLDKCEAEHVGRDADGNELYRVWRDGLGSGDPARVDVLRLRPQEGPGFDFVGSADPARPGASYFTIAPACVGKPAYDAFLRTLAEHGCVLENEWDSGRGIFLVFTHPEGLPFGEWYERMLRETIGVAPDELREYLYGEALAKEQESARRRSRERTRRRLSRGARTVGSLARFLVVVGLIVLVGGGGMTQLLAAAPSDRPRMAAIGTILALAPLLLTRDGRRLWPLLLCGAAAGVALVALLEGPSPAYAGAAALAAVYALCFGGMGVMLGFFSGFASSGRQMGLVVFGVVLPMLASAAAAVSVAIMSAAAAGSAAGVGSGARTVAVALTALLLLGPAAVMVMNGGAILGSRAWRANPKLLLGALATLPRMTVPLLRRVALPLAILWAVVWLLARLG